MATEKQLRRHHQEMCARRQPNFLFPAKGVFGRTLFRDFMTHIIQATKIQETKLWQILSKSQNADAKTLLVAIPQLCEDASSRMKAMREYAPQFTLHDDRHLLRITELMATILGSVADQLNPIELSLLILSAFFHDQGMVLSKEEFSSLNSNEKYKLFSDNWIVDHPNYSEITDQLNSQTISGTYKVQITQQLSDLNSALLIDFIRETHGSRSADFINSSYDKDPRLIIQSVSIAALLAKLCESHTLHYEYLKPENGFHWDELVGRYSVNLPFLAAVLRLADILDFDRDRTPEVLIKSIHFTSSISLIEWEKHRSVEGWHISPDLIRFNIKCKLPAYEAAARKYMDWIDAELDGFRQICRFQPKNVDGYKIDLPTKVDRSRIGPYSNSYRFHDLEFNLSRDQIIRLLMTDKLYERPHLCIRELLQNSLDAIRYRKAISLEKEIKWEHGKIEMRHFVNTDGYEVIECEDNGCGMDEEIITNYFTKVGKSFYRSPFFERERNRLKASGNDFDPCSQFGIGFMSCFMLGDRITVKTRRDYGPGKEWGPPLIIEIHGLSGLLIIREGPNCQSIGTTVSIISRKRPSFLDSWTDQVQLCMVLKGYALVTEFPISGRCDIPEISESISIPPTIEKYPTVLEKAHLEDCITLEQDLSIVSPYLKGFVRESFLKDENGLPCLCNKNSEWRGINNGNTFGWNLFAKQTGIRLGECKHSWEHIPVCVDGILIAGKPGRANHRENASSRLGVHNSQIYSISPALIDARGSMKPEITPSRTRPDSFRSIEDLSWKRLAEKFYEGAGKLWEQLLAFIENGLSAETFYKLTIMHNIQPSYIPHEKLWKSLSVMLTKEGERPLWRFVRDLGELTFANSNDSFALFDYNGFKIGPSPEMKAWESQGENHPYLDFCMNMTTLLMTVLEVRDAGIILTIDHPSKPNIALSQFALSSRVGIDRFLIRYTGAANDAITVETPFPTANRNHPLVILSHESRYIRKPTPLQKFARSFVACISDTVSTKKQTPTLEKPDYWQKRVGHLYFEVSWDEHNSNLRPPYKLWTKDKGFFHFDENDFAIWRDACLKKE